MLEIFGEEGFNSVIKDFNMKMKKEKGRKQRSLGVHQHSVIAIKNYFRHFDLKFNYSKL